MSENRQLSERNKSELTRLGFEWREFRTPAGAPAIAIRDSETHANFEWRDHTNELVAAYLLGRSASAWASNAWLAAKAFTEGNAGITADLHGTPSLDELVQSLTPGEEIRFSYSETGETVIECRYDERRFSHRPTPVWAQRHIVDPVDSTWIDRAGEIRRRLAQLLTQMRDAVEARRR